PHWAQEIVEESYPPIAPGSVAQVITSVPGTYGLLRRPFTAVHSECPSRFSFVDQLKKRPLSQCMHTHEFSSVAGGTKNDDYVEYAMAQQGFDVIDRRLCRYLEATFEARHRRMLMDVDFLESTNAPLVTRKKGKRILIAGGSGLIGRQVAALFSTAGHFVRLL